MVNVSLSICTSGTSIIRLLGDGDYVGLANCRIGKLSDYSGEISM